MIALSTEVLAPGRIAKDRRVPPAEAGDTSRMTREAGGPKQRPHVNAEAGRKFRLARNVLQLGGGDAHMAPASTETAGKKIKRYTDYV